MPETDVQDSVVAQEQVSGTPSLADFASMAFSMERPEIKEAMVAASGGVPSAPSVPPEGTPGSVDVANKFDEEGYIKSIGFENLEKFQSALTEYKQLKENPPVAQLSFANDEAKRFAEYFSLGKEDELREALNARATVKGIETMGEEQKLKLFIKMNNPGYDQEIIDYAYNKNYAFNEKAFMDEEGNVIDPIGLKQAKIDANYKVQADLTKANDYFNQYKTKIELPGIQVANTPDNEYEAYKASAAKDAEIFEKVMLPSVSSLTEQQVPLSVSIKDPGNQMDFSATITPDKADLDRAKQAALNPVALINRIAFDEKGTFYPDRLVKFALIAENYDKYVQSQLRQAVNAERQRVVTKETPDANVQRNFVTNEQPDRLSELKKLVFHGVNIPNRTN